MIEPFTSFTGTVAPLDVDNVDTDAIIPKQFLKRTERTGYGQFLFYDWRFQDGKERQDFILNEDRYRGASVLLARKNFGCGSSREHAPWALSDYGFWVIIAPSFADIFYNNCFKNGILPIVLSEDDVDTLFQRTNKKIGFQLSVDLENQRVIDSNGFEAYFEITPYRKRLLQKGLDEIGSTLEFKDKIKSFEEQHRIYYRIAKNEKTSI
jgi:3-isopropylmalate/(R)-2-methylmalate dehydratase small subunit